MYECNCCGKIYEKEQDAIDCCPYSVETDEDGDIYFKNQSKTMIPHAKTHYCPNVKHGGKNWSVWLEVNEKCPMCDYIFNPR